MSWFNGQILRPTELKALNGLDFKTTHAFGKEVKMWLELGEKYQSVPAIVAGVTVGAQGSVCYKLAVEIEGTGLFTTVEIPSGWVTNRGVTNWKGPTGEADGDELRHYMNQDRPQLSLVQSGTAPEKNMKGIYIQRDAFRGVDRLSEELGAALHEAANKATKKLIGNASGRFDFDLKLVVRSLDDVVMHYNGRMVKTGLYPAGAVETYRAIVVSAINSSGEQLTKNFLATDGIIISDYIAEFVATGDIKQTK